MEALLAVGLAAVIIEKIVERIKEKAPSVQSWLTSVVALILSIGLVYGVPQLRLLGSLFEGDVEPLVDLGFSALAVAAGSGFVASLESFLLPPRDFITVDVDVDHDNDGGL